MNLCRCHVARLEPSSGLKLVVARPRAVYLTRIDGVASRLHLQRLSSPGEYSATVVTRSEPIPIRLRCPCFHPRLWDHHPTLTGDSSQGSDRGRESDVGTTSSRRRKTHCAQYLATGRRAALTVIESRVVRITIGGYFRGSLWLSGKRVIGEGGVHRL